MEWNFMEWISTIIICRQQGPHGMLTIFYVDDDE